MGIIRTPKRQRKKKHPKTPPAPTPAPHTPTTPTPTNVSNDDLNNFFKRIKDSINTEVNIFEAQRSQQIDAMIKTRDNKLADLARQKDKEIEKTREEAYEQGRLDGHEEGVRAGWKKATHAIRKVRPEDTELTTSSEEESEDDIDDEA